MGDSVTVLDYGSRWMKAGWAYNFPTEDEPRVMTPSAVYVDPETVEEMEVDGGSKELQHPVRAGKIVDWQQFESLTYYVLYDLMGWELGNEGNIMLCEPILTGRTDREYMTQLMFEVFNVSGFFVQDQAVLSLFAVGRTSGLVVDVGHDKVDISTIMDGAVNPTTVRRLPYGGENLTLLMQRLMRESAASASTAHQQPQQSISVDTAEALKELCVKVADSATSYNTATAASGGPAPDTYQLPDGQTFSISAADALRVGEALFQPTALLGVRGANIAEAAVDAAACILEPVLRKAMYDNIVVVGGGAMIPGLSPRFLSEVRSLLPMAYNAALCPMPEYIPAPAVPRDAAWVGGSVLAKVAQLQNQFIVKADYEEAGPTAVHRRCV